MKKLMMLKYRNKKIIPAAFLAAFFVIFLLFICFLVIPKTSANEKQTIKNSCSYETFCRMFKIKKPRSLSNIDTLMNPIPTITINRYGKISKYKVPYDTVKNTLRRLKIVLDSNDVTGAELDDYIHSGDLITITKIEYSEQAKNEVVPFKIKTVKSDDMLIGESKVVQKGRNGEKLCIYKNAYYNSKLWRSQKVKETVVIPAVDKIIKTGTKNIIENKNVNTKSNKSILVKCKNDDKNFTLPKVELSAHDRDLLERLLTGEFGGSFTGACLVAQAIKCAIVYDNYKSIDNLIIGMGYVGSTNIGKTQNAVDAVKFIFDENALAVKHRLFYMCTEDYYNSDPGNFHSTQNFILQYQNVKFFDRW